MSIPKIKISLPDFYGKVRIISEDTIGLDTQLHIENFLSKLLKQVVGSPATQDTFWSIQQKLNNELFKLVSTGILRKDFDEKWFMTEILDVSEVGIAEVYKRVFSLKEAVDYVY